MTANDVLDKIQHLPKEVQQHLYLYVDFLYHTYQDQPDTNASPTFFQSNELTESGKAFLEQRVAEANARPDKQMNWREARKKIHEKHDLPL